MCCAVQDGVVNKKGVMYLANFWTANYLQKRRDDWLKTIVKAQYRVGVTYYDAVITEKKIEGDTFVVFMLIDHTATGTVNINYVRLIDVGGEVAGERAENITKSGTQGVLMKFEFPLREV